MRLSRVIKIASFITILALSYIHMQMNIFQLAYQGKTQEKEIRQYIEHNGSLTQKILTLKSSANLGDKMLTEKSHMQFVDSSDIVQVPTRPVNTKSKTDQNLLSLGPQLK